MDEYLCILHKLCNFLIKKRVHYSLMYYDKEVAAGTLICVNH